MVDYNCRYGTNLDRVRDLHLCMSSTDETLCCPSEIQGDQKRTLFYDENVYKIVWDHNHFNSTTEKCIKRVVA